MLSKICETRHLAVDGGFEEHYLRYHLALEISRIWEKTVNATGLDGKEQTVHVEYSKI